MPARQPPWAGSTRRARLPKEWHAQRQRILRIHGRICHLCGGPGADAVDHVRPGDDHSDENLRPVHDKVPPHCHRAKSSAEGGQANGVRRRAQVAARKRPAEAHPGEVHRQ
jgi:5-methylcytosine-specific restriction protein A